jgi:hypothetical protein
LDSVLQLQSELAGEAIRANERFAAKEGGPRIRGVRLPRFSLRRLRRKEFAPGIALGVAPASAKDFVLAIRVQRRELLKAAVVEDLIRSAHGEVEVRVIGKIKTRQAPRDRPRPVTIGSSAAHRDVYAGTLGCFVRTGAGEVCALSNNHILANENRAAVGDPILQPSAWDGGSDPDDVIAHLAAFESLQTNQTNRVDCAIAALAAGIEYDPRSLTGGGTLNAEPLEPLADLRVEKIGRTTGRTVGRISALNVIVLGVEYDIGTLRFDGQLEIEDTDQPFSDAGDSGALIVDADGHRPVGLLFSGDEEPEPGRPGVTYANPIAEVLQALQATLLH